MIHRRVRFWILLALIVLVSPAISTLAQTQTPNLGLTKPSVGSLNWGPTINTDLDLVDTKLAAAYYYQASAGSGLNLNIAAGSAFCGNPPVKVDYAGGTLTMTNAATNYVYLDPTASCAPASNTTGFTAGVIPLAQVVAAGGAITGVTDVRTWFVDPNSLGPVIRADLMPGADAGAQIIAAIAALPSTGGTVDGRRLEGPQTITQDLFAGITKSFELLLGDATYTISANQTITANGIRISGQSKYKTRLTFTTVAGNAFDVNIPFTDFNRGGHSFVLRDIFIEGPNAGTGNGVVIKGAYQFILDSIQVHKFGNDGIVIDTTAGGNTDSGSLRTTNSTQNGRYGFYTVGPDSNLITFISCGAFNNGSHGFYFTRPWILLLGTDSSNNTGDGYLINTYYTAGHIYGEGNLGTADLHFSATAAGNTIDCLNGGMTVVDDAGKNTYRKSDGSVWSGWYNWPVNDLLTPVGGMTIANRLDANLAVDFRPGIATGAARAVILYFQDKDAVRRWQIDTTTANVLEIIDTVNSVGRLTLDPQGNTYLSAGGGGAYGVIVNGLPNTGTGGLSIRSGGASPTEKAVISGAGLGTFNGGVTTPLQLASTAATGTAPLVVASTTPVANLSLSGGAGTSVSVAKLSTPVNVVTFSATPTFDASLGNTQKITLTANVTSSTLSNATAGQTINFIICQDATGSRTFVWPTNFLNAPSINSGPNQCKGASFVFDGTNGVHLE